MSRQEVSHIIPYRRILTILGALAIGVTVSARACSVCVLPGGGLSAMHPRSIAVAIATGAARQEGLLASAAMSDNELSNLLARWARIERFARRVMDSQQGRDAGSLSLICVDTGARTSFKLEHGVCREIPPALRGPELVTALTMVTSEAALEMLMAGTLSFSAAVVEGLVYVEDRDAQVVVFEGRPKPKSAETELNVVEIAGSDRLVWVSLLIGAALPVLLVISKASRRSSMRAGAA
jgi:hypothetical protein